MDGWGEMMDGRPTYDDLILPAQWTSLAARSTPTKTLWGEGTAVPGPPPDGQVSGPSYSAPARCVSAHSRAKRWASAIWARVMSLASASRAWTGLSSPRTLASVSHLYATV